MYPPYNTFAVYAAALAPGIVSLIAGEEGVAYDLHNIIVGNGSGSSSSIYLYNEGDTLAEAELLITTLVGDSSCISLPAPLLGAAGAGWSFEVGTPGSGIIVSVSLVLSRRPVIAV